MLFKLIICACVLYQTLALQCYTGIDSQCLLMDISQSANGCGDGITAENCACAKYRMQCTAGDTACTPEEQRTKKFKWAYIVSTDEMCRQLKQAPAVYQQLTCCKKNKCNAPASKRVKCLNMVASISAAGKKKTGAGHPKNA